MSTVETYQPSPILETIQSKPPPLWISSSPDPHLAICQTGEAPIEHAPTPLSDDPDFARCHMAHYVRGQGVSGAERYLTDLKQELIAFRALNPMAIERAQKMERAITNLETELRKLKTERDAYIGGFEPMALDKAKSLLADSRANIDSSIARYGAREKEVGEPFGGKHLEYEIDDNADTRDLRRAAGALAQKSDEVARLKAMIKPVYEAGEQPAYAKAGMTYHQVNARIAKAEREYAELCAKEWKAHPILASFRDSPRSLKAIASANAGAASVVGTELFDVRRNIGSMERRLEKDPSCVWSLRPLIEATLSANHVDDASMGASFARHQMKDVAFDQKLANDMIDLLAIGLGIAAFIPSGGASLAVAATLSGGADAYAFYRALEDYQFKTAASKTDPHPENALGDEHPSVLPLVIQGAGVAGGAVAVVVTAAQLGRFVRAIHLDESFGLIAIKVRHQIGDERAAALFDKLGKETFQKLGSDLSGEEMERLLASSDASSIAYLAEHVDALDLERVIRRLGKETFENVRGSMGAKELLCAEADLGTETVRALAPALKGDGLSRLHLALGDMLKGHTVTAIGDRVVIDGVADLPTSTLLSLAETNRSALGALLKAKTDLGTATIEDLIAIKSAAERAGARVTPGFVEAALGALRKELDPVKKLGIGAGDVRAQRVVESIEKLGLAPPRRVLGKGDFVVDSQLGIAQHELKAVGFKKLQDAQKRAVAWLRKHASKDGKNLAIGDASVLEIRRGAQWGGFQMTCARSSPEYQRVLARLKDAAVGEAKGGIDRSLVADLFFAKTEPGVTPRFVVQDKIVYRRLAEKFADPPLAQPLNQGYKDVLERYPNGFIAKIDGRSILVIPIRPY